jgi:hypothetical protein
MINAGLIVRFFERVGRDGFCAHLEIIGRRTNEINRNLERQFPLATRWFYRLDAEESKKSRRTLRNA